MTYNNGKTETITKGFTCSPSTFSTAGAKTVTVSYKGKTTTFTVNVTAASNVTSGSAGSISVTTKPEKTTYYVGETLDTSGLTLKMTYNNGKTETITNGFTCSPSTFSTAGTTTVTVSYGGKKTTFSVSVNRPKVILSRNKADVTMDCWDSDWNSNRAVPLWKIDLPIVETQPSGGSVSWSIVSGSAYLTYSHIAAQQPGTIVARATYTYCGISYSADYSVILRIVKTPASTNYLKNAPSNNATTITTIPTGATVTITEIAWDAAVQKSDGLYYLWGKTTYNGKTGWIVIS